MPHDLDLILTLTGGLSAALLLGLLTQALKLSPIVGYLLAGVCVGPFTPGFVAHAGIAEQLSELGVILLMFGVGLQFHLRELLAVRTVALPGAIVQILAASALGYALAAAAGWGHAGGLVFGIAISVASTVVLLRMLSDRGALHTRPGHLDVGWLVVEDLFTVLVLVLLPVLASPGQSSGSALLFALGTALAKVGALVAFTLLFGQHFIPKLLDYVARTRSRELFTLTGLVLALGIALGSAKIFGVSMALGAFLAGMVVGQSDFSSRAASEALPMRDAFAVLFFVSMGMLFDPASLLDNAGVTLATLAIVLLAKPLAALCVVLLLGRPLRAALLVAVALAQIGEFSFILAAMGRQLEVLPAAAAQVLVVASIVSITVNPFLFRLIDPLAQRFSRAQATHDPEPAVEPAHGEEGPGALIVGYGPVGHALTKVLADNGVQPCVVELNHDTVRALREQGICAVYGDATQREILVQAGVTKASGLIFTASGGAVDAVIRAAKELNPRLLVIARTSYLTEAATLRRAGAQVVVTEEAEVALAMAERVLSALGATAEQLDRERDRVRATLGAATTA
jgi:CPA2 family monovalent cation:H+ antiporter-2